MKLPYQNLLNRPNGCASDDVLTVNPKSNDMGIPCYPKSIMFNGEIALETEFHGYYATRSGHIVSIKVKGGHGKIDPSNPREHSYKIDKDGYLECCFSVFENGKQKRIYRRAHRVVWETWNGKIPGDLTIDHIDADVSNNDLSNLQLMSREDNTSKALAGVPSSKRFFYNLYKNDIYIGCFDRKQLKDRIGLIYRDYYHETKRKKSLVNDGYRWILGSVEDNERVSCSDRLLPESN